jgi:hypothetical protein
MGLFDSDADKAFDARFDDNSYVSGVNGVNVTSFSGFKKYVKHTINISYKISGFSLYNLSILF